MAHDTIIVIWARGNSAAAIDQQLDALLPYARDTWGDDFPIDADDDRVKKAMRTQTNAELENNVAIVATRTDTDDRDGLPGDKYIEQSIETKPLQRLAVPTLATTDAELVEKALTTPNEYTDGVDVHDVQRGITLKNRTDVQPVVRRAITELTDTTRDDGTTPLNGGTPHDGGRPPLGTRVQDGMLVADDNYDDVCRVLQHVDHGVMSAATAAHRLDCCRRTIVNATDRRDLYQLD